VNGWLAMDTSTIGKRVIPIGKRVILGAFPCLSRSAGRTMIATIARVGFSACPDLRCLSRSAFPCLSRSAAVPVCRSHNDRNDRTGRFQCLSRSARSGRFQCLSRSARPARSDLRAVPICALIVAFADRRVWGSARPHSDSQDFSAPLDTARSAAPVVRDPAGRALDREAERAHPPGV